MKKSLLLSLTLLSTSAMAYELISFSPTKPRTQEEILKESNQKRENLQSFKCDNQNRMELFFDTAIQNMAMNSLKVYSKKEDKTYTYFDGKLFNENNNRVRSRDKFVKRALKVLTRYEKNPETRRLVSELQGSPYPFVIKKGGNRYSPNHTHERPNWHNNNVTMIMNLDERRPMIDRLPFSQIGYGGQILWNPSTKASFMESDNVIRKVNTDIILAHEMLHAYDGMRGLLDRRFVKSETHEFQPVAEYRAVRMENIVRKAMGYKHRRFYSTPSVKNTNELDFNQDMLDENNETIILPTPCINWIK